MRRLRRVVAVVLASILVSVASLLGYIHYRMNYCVTTVLPGRLYRSSEMTPERLAREAAEQHIAEVIDLRNPGYDDKGRRTVNTGEKIQLEDNALQAAGIRHVSLPATQIPDDYTVDRFLAEIETAGSRPVLIHCDHGIGRTGLFIALYLIEYAGYSNEDARHCVSRYYSLRLHGRKHFAPDYNKGEYIMDYTLRRKLTAPIRDVPRQ